MADAGRLPRSFYRGPVLEVARALLGKVVVHRVRGRATAGMIVEVEAYGGEDDPACHAAAGLTSRNAPLYGSPGYAYVYLNYGIHYLLNAVTGPLGFPAAVLIRALSPLEGLDAMRRRRRPGRRGAEPPADEALCRGPGNLTRALGVTLRQNRLDLCGERLFIEDRGLPVEAVRWGPRIGIAVGTARPWRGYVTDCPAVSQIGPREGRRRLAAGVLDRAGPL